MGKPSYNRNNDETQGTASFIFSRKKIKYSLLKEFLLDSVIESSVNLFIDMNYVLDISRIKFYKDSYTEAIKDSNTMMAELLGLIIHYRRFFLFNCNCNKFKVILLFDSGKIDLTKTTFGQYYHLDKLNKTVKPGFLGFLGEKIKKIAHCIPDTLAINSDKIDLSVIPLVIKDIIPNAKNNIFLSNEPAFNQMSRSFKGFRNIHANGTSSKCIAIDGYFENIYRSAKYSIKDPSEIKTSDSYIPLLEALTKKSVEDLSLMGTKKAIDLINTLKVNNPILSDWKTVLETTEFNEDEICYLLDSQFLFDNYVYINLLDEGDKASITSQVGDMNRFDRDEFLYYNRKFFNNAVDDSLLFAR